MNIIATLEMSEQQSHLMSLTKRGTRDDHVVDQGLADFVLEWRSIEAREVPGLGVKRVLSQRGHWGEAAGAVVDNS
jgi:hypothetical protein